MSMEEVVSLVNLSHRQYNRNLQYLCSMKFVYKRSIDKFRDKQMITVSIRVAHFRKHTTHSNKSSILYVRFNVQQPNFLELLR